MAANIYGVVCHKNATPSPAVSRGFLFPEVTFFDSLKYADAYQKRVSQENPGYSVYVVRGISISKSQSTTPIKVEITEKDEILPQD